MFKRKYHYFVSFVIDNEEFENMIVKYNGEIKTEEDISNIELMVGESFLGEDFSNVIKILSFHLLFVEEK